MSAAQSARPPARSEVRGVFAFEHVFESPAVLSSALVDLLMSVRLELARDVIVRAARITGTDQDHASIRSRLDEAIELARQLPGTASG